MDTTPGTLVERLRDFKIVTLLLALLVAGMAIVIGVNFWPKWNVSWLDSIGQALVSASLIGLCFDFFVRREVDAVLVDRVSTAIEDLSEVVSGRVIEAALYSQDALVHLDANRLGQVVERVLSTRLGDDQLGMEVASYFLPLFGSRSTRSRDLDLDMRIFPDVDAGSESERYMTVSYSYRFRAVLRRREYSLEFSESGGSIYDRVGDEMLPDFYWNLGSTRFYKLDNEDFVKVRNVRIGPYDLVLNREVISDINEAPVTVRFVASDDRLKGLLGREVEIVGRVEFKAAKNGIYLTIPMLHPSRGLRFSVSYDLAELGLDWLSIKQQLLAGVAASHDEMRITEGKFLQRIETDRWIPPGGALVLIWRKSDEALFGGGFEPAQ